MKKQKQTNKKRGFSLAELMVVFTIMTIMMIVLVKYSSGSRSNKELELAAREVAQAIRQMQNNALNGKMPIDNDDTTFACGYVFAYGINNKDYKLGYLNKNITGCAQNSSVSQLGSVSSNTLKNNVLFADLANNKPNALYFNIPHGEIYFDNNYQNKVPLNSTMGVGSVVTITLRSVAAGTSRADVCVCASGKVEEQPLRKNTTASNCQNVCK